MTSGGSDRETALHQRSGPLDPESERTRRGVDRSRIEPLRRELLQRVGPGVELVAMGAGDLDRNQDVAPTGAVRPALGHLDEVIPESGEDRLRDGVEGERARRLLEVGVELALSPGAEITAAVARHRVG